MPPDALDEAFAAEASSMVLPGGTSLAEVGDTVQALCRLTAGRLAEFEPTTEGGGRLEQGPI